MWTYWAYVYNPINGGTYCVPITAEQDVDARAIAEAQYGSNLRSVKVHQD